jgi:hypothetical protein
MHLLTTHLDQYVGAIQSDVNNPTGAGITPASITLPTGAAIVEFSIDGTLAGNSDTVVPTEKAVKTYVDLRALITSLNAACMIGAANSAWVPCVFSIESVVGKVIYASNISNVDGVDFYLYYEFPLPVSRGGLKLYLTGIRCNLVDADNVGPDSVSRAIIYGTENDAAPLNIVLNDQNPPNPAWNAIGSYTETFAAVDCSSYASIHVALACTVTTAFDLDIGSVCLQVYYDS